MKHAVATVVLSTSALLQATAAQDTPGVPAPELQRFTPMLGSWEGSGLVHRQPGSPGTAWTARSRVEWILDGHFLRNDTRVDMGGAAPGPLVFRSLYGWDATRKCATLLTITNMGELAADHELRWVDEHTLVGTTHGFEEGLPFVERWSSTYSGDSYTFAVERAYGTGPFHVHAEGSMERSALAQDTQSNESSKNLLSARAVEGSPCFGAPPAAMGRLDPLLGSYTLKGKRALRPDAPAAVDVTGGMSMEPMFGGAILAVHAEIEATGERTPAEVIGYTGWDARAGCYRYFALDNHGMRVPQEGCLLEDGTLLFTSAGVVGDRAAAQRTRIEFADDGAIRSVATDRIQGDGPSRRVYEATYERISRPAGGSPAD